MTHASEQPDIIQVDVSRSTPTTLDATVNSAYGMKAAMLMLMGPSEDPNSLRVLATRPLDVIPSYRPPGLSTCMNGACRS